MAAVRYCVVACLVALAALEVRYARAAAATLPREDEKVAFELREVLDGSFSAEGFGAIWVSESKIASVTDDGIVTHDFSSDAEDVILVTSEQLEETGSTSPGSWAFSKDLTKLLWSYDVRTGYRHSTEAKYSVFDTVNKKWKHLNEGKHLQTARLAPKGNSAVYVFENNVYYVEDIWGDNTPRPITTDGSEVIYNGVPDWVYEEEVLSSGSALWLSPQESYLAYARFDDTNVDEFSYIIYGEDQYTNVETLRYPKPGKNNPKVEICVVNLLKESKPYCTVVEGLEQPILQTVAWAGDKKFLVVWLNRIQSEIKIVSYTASEDTADPEGSKNSKDPKDPALEEPESEWKAKEEFSGKEDNGWYQVSTPRAVSDTKWAMLLPQPSSGEDHYLRPVIFEGDVRKDLVPDKITASALYGWNTESNLVFYQAAPEGKPGQRQVYSVADNDDTIVKCLSCDFKQIYNDSLCLYAGASFSTDFSHVAITCSGPGPAAVGVFQVKEDGSLGDGDYWQKNEDLITKLNGRLLPDVEATTITVEEGYTAQVRLWLPPNLDKSKKYPMLVFVYGGPGSQQVSEGFSVGWGYHLTTAKNIIYASIDGRGSGFQGNKNLFALYKKLGTVEVDDQILVTSQLLEKYPYIDKDRVGIWGWSYGGYATAKALTRDPKHVFACGASVAPVTSWKLYDTIYTERYMDQPGSNEEGYDKADVNLYIQGFKNHSFYLLHGNADDNVHYQQSMRLARTLEKEGVLFEQQSYPDENHGIRSQMSVLVHVYKSLGAFFDRCFEEEKEVTTGAAEHVLPALLPALLFPLFSWLLV